MEISGLALCVLEIFVCKELGSGAGAAVVPWRRGVLAELVSLLLPCEDAARVA